MTQTRVGVIGAGSWAVASHLPNFAAREDVELVGISRLGSTELERVRRAFDVPVASEDYRDVLALAPDVVLVSSPANVHHEHAKAALEAGAHVLLEKPVTIDPAQAWDLAGVAERAKRHVVVAFGWNHRPMVREAKRLMCEHGIGDVEALSIQMSSATRELLSNSGAYPDADPLTRIEPATWVDPQVSGGGYGQAQLSHAFALALWLCAERVDGAFALTSAPMRAPVELHDAISLRLRGGGIGTVFGGSAWSGAGDNKHQLSVTAIGSQGQLRVDVGREDVWLFRGDGTEFHPDYADPAGAYDCTGPVDTIVELARGQTDRNDSPLELGARTVEALELVYRSAHTGAYVRREES